MNRLTTRIVNFAIAPLCVVLSTSATQAQERWEAKFQEFLTQNPQLARSIRAREVAKDGVLWMLKQGAVDLDENNRSAQRARAEKALKAAIKIMTTKQKLSPASAEKLYGFVFEQTPDWEAKYAAYLKANPSVASAVKNGKVTKEQVLAGIKARVGEGPMTEEQQLDALHQKLIKENPALGRAPKAQLMPRLKAMLERGDGKSLRPEKTLQARQMEFGLVFSNLIETGQIARFDKDLKLVFDVGITEIVRQAGSRRSGKGGEKNELADRQKKFRAKIGELVRAGKLTRAEAGELWKLAFGDERVRRQGGGRRRREDGDERRRDR